MDKLSTKMNALKKQGFFKDSPLGKRAMSPLLSTFILIGFAIALGGVVMSWGKSGYSVEKPIGGCEQTSLEVISYGSNSGLCNTDNRLHFTVQNNGEIALTGARISLVGSSGVYSGVINTRVAIADVIRSNLLHPNIGDIEKVIFIPKFNHLGEEKLCPKQGFATEGIGDC